MTNPGARYRNRIKFSRRTITMVEGEAVASWSDFCDAYALVSARAINPTSAVIGGVVPSGTSYFVATRWTPLLATVVPDDVITLADGRQLVIDGVINQNEANIELRFTATETTPTGVIA